MTTSAKAKAKPVYRCGICGRRLREGRWVFSRFTGARYCMPKQGCKR